MVEFVTTTRPTLRDAVMQSVTNLESKTGRNLRPYYDYAIYIAGITYSILRKGDEQNLPGCETRIPQTLSQVAGFVRSNNRLGVDVEEGIVFLKSLLRYNPTFIQMLDMFYKESRQALFESDDRKRHVFYIAVLRTIMESCPHDGYTILYNW